MNARATAVPTHDMMLVSGRWRFHATGGEQLRPVFGADPISVASELMEDLRRRERDTGQAQVLCGLIPFSEDEPALLRFTDRAGFRARRSTAIAVPATVGVRGARAMTPPNSEHYRGIVRSALREIDAGTVQKVVLARTMDLELPADSDHLALAEAAVERLELANPAADVFLVGDGTAGFWLGASPEVIADVRAGRFLTHPLAGSLPGGVSREEAELSLVSSEKDLSEHAFVVEHIAAALRPFAEHIRLPDAPRLFATDAMWHLGTQITGQLRPGVGSLEMALALHPTPAVCGTPSRKAARLIRELEAEPRGFYAGLVGWTDATGDGRWSLMLRSAHMSPARLRLQAGAGIVAGSDPETEHAETAAKFATVLRSLEGLL